MQLPSYVELFAFCVNATPADDDKNDFVHLWHLYKVKSFVTDDDNFFPYGVRIDDVNENELTQTFHMLRFLYMHSYLN